MRRTSRGNSLIEFTLAAIPLIFVLISTVEICRGMWDYHSLAQAVKMAARAASTKGAGCAGQGCAMNVDQVAHLVNAYALGMPAANLNVTLTSAAGSVTCNPLNSCYGNSATWPPSGGNTVGQTITIAGSYAFTSAIAMYAPGAGAMKFSGVTLTASSQQAIQF